MKMKEEMIKEYIERVMDLYVDSCLWDCIAKKTDDEDLYNKYMNISKTLKELFNNEIQSMIL